MKLIKTFLLILWSFLLVACNGIPLASVPSASSVKPSSEGKVISSHNVANLIEVKRLSLGQAGPVAAIKFPTNSATLLIAYAAEDILREWSLIDNAIKRTITIHPLALGGIAFDAPGSLVAIGAGPDWLLHKDDDAFLGVQIWNIDAGYLVRRVGEKYDIQSKSLTRNFASQVLLTPNGNWTLMIDTVADPDLKNLKNLTMYEVNSGRIGDLAVDLSRKPGENSFDAIALDATGEYLASADRLGKVAVIPFQPPHYPKTGEIVIQQAGSSETKTFALGFDPLRKWLAAIQGVNLVVWSLQSPSFERQLDAVIATQESDSVGLIFSPTGDLLAVNTIDGWEIWDIENRQLLLKHSGVPVSAVAFSPDGRLFAWGDTQGVVHIWGVKE